MNYETKYVAAHGVSQNCEMNFSASRRQYSDKEVRHATKKMFERKLVNGETLNRSWLVNSESKGCVYCVPCMLFGDEVFHGSESLITGFNDWKNAHTRILEHENSSSHKTSWYSES